MANSEAPTDLKSQLASKLGESCYTLGDVIVWVKRSSRRFSQLLQESAIQNVFIDTTFSSGGYVSEILRVVVGFQNQLQPFSVIVKIPAVRFRLEGLKIENNHAETFSRVHETECTFYELFHESKAPGLAQIYYIEKDSEKRPGILVMEDLSKTTLTLGFFKSATLELNYNLLRLLARFQAHAMYATGWKGRFVEDVYTTKFHKLFMDPLLPGLIEYDPATFQPLLNKLKPLNNPEFTKYALLDKPSEYSANALCHGDCWANNLLVAKNEDGSASNMFAAIVDWQTAFEGNPMHDLSRFLISTNDGDVRREIQPNAPATFYRLLNEECRKLNKNHNGLPYSEEQLSELFDLALIQQTLAYAIAVPFVNMDQKNADVPKKLHEARVAKIALRTRLALEDAINLMHKHKLDQFN